MALTDESVAIGKANFSVHLSASSSQQKIIETPINVVNQTVRQ